MPRILNYLDATAADTEQLALANLSVHSEIVQRRCVGVVEDVDGMDEDVHPVGSLVYSADLDGTAPWCTAEEFYDQNLYYPYAHVWYDCSECQDEGCYHCQDEDTYDPYGEESSDDPGASNSRMFVKALANRPTRMTSVEIEVGMGGNHLAEAFYNAGLSTYSHMGGYHDMSDDTFVRVEEDSSVAAEVIFSRMKLDTPAHVGDFEQGVGIIRGAINEGRCKLDMRCGLHIHVNLARESEAIPAYGMDAVASLYHLWNYLEDTIFRLGSANWKGHRSEFGNDYAPKTHKGLLRQLEIGRNMNGSRGALNLSNYLGARHNCSCGAFDFGNWRECTCNLGRSTVEFRVFNTSANSRKIRAYVALCQALVAAAAERRFNPDDFPAFEWTDGADVDVAASKERLEFILNELPLTNDERQDLLYCAEKSSLSAVLDQEYLRVLWNANE